YLVAHLSLHSFPHDALPISWIFGLPTSSSHALIGGYAGSAVAKAGFGVIIPSGWTKTLLFIVLSPLIGMVLGALLMTLNQWIFRDRKSTRLNSSHLGISYAV